MNLHFRQVKLLGLASLGLALVCMNPACGSDKKGSQGSSSGGAANTNTSSGGAADTNASSGGAQATGGTHSDDGGIVNQVSCSENEDCEPLNMVCDTSIALCVRCIGPDCEKVDSGASCVTSGGNPCSRIAPLVGAQTVDGEGDEFCNVAPVELDADSAAKVIAYNAEPPEVLTARIATSAVGLHAYIEVVDSSVQAVDTVDSSQSINQAYQGDSVELMFSSSNGVTGLTSADASTLHVIVPAKGPAVATKASNSSGASQGAATALPTTQYAQRLTSTGYALELQLPWPGGSAPSPGSNIRFDLLLNSADSTFGNVSDMRDGQLIYHLGEVSGTSCQGTPAAEGTVPFCDDRTWCVTTIGG
jgi:hypothetical protein